jgi:predicted transcriptional regulator
MNYLHVIYVLFHKYLIMRGEVLKIFLRNKVVVMAEVARKMNISPQQFSNMLNTKDISTGKLEMILKAANIADFNKQIKVIEKQLNSIKIKVDLDNSVLENIKSSIQQMQAQALQMAEYTMSQGQIPQGLLESAIQNEVMAAEQGLGIPQ